MKDGIIKGTGNSRFLKSVENFKTLYPTYDAFITALVAGTLPVDLNGINAEGWEQIGDALGKYSLLKDATAEALGLGSAALPDNALRVLSRLHTGLGNEYLWAKTGELSIVIGEMQSAQLSNSAAALITVQYSESVESVDGNIQLVNPQTISFIASQYSSYIGTIAGKYANITSNQGHNCFGLVDSFNMQNSAALYVTYYAVRISATQTSYVNSPDPNAYPPAIDDGYTYTALGMLGEKVRIATGSYVGTGATNVSLTFPFEPKFVMVGHPYYNSYWLDGFYWHGENTKTVRMASGTTTNYVVTITKSGNTISWKGAANVSAANMVNASGTTYHYFAIG